MPAQREVMVLSGTQLRQLLALGHVVATVESAYLTTAAGQARIYPVIRELLPSGSVFGIKSGYRGTCLKEAGYSLARSPGASAPPMTNQAIGHHHVCAHIMSVRRDHC